LKTAPSIIEITLTRNSRGSFKASRRSVLMRSPGARGIREGAITQGSVEFTASRLS